MAAALAAGACDYVMPDLERIGGVTGWQRAAALAAAHGIEMSSHLFPEVSAHLLAATPTCALARIGRLGRRRSSRSRCAIEDGFAVVPERPGNGLVLEREGGGEVSDVVQRHCEEAEGREAISCGGRIASARWRASQ